jgi:phage shock protein C
MNSYNRVTRRGLYRSRKGVILGVCRGVADYFDFSVFWIRAIAVILFLFTGFWPIAGIYILAALLMKSNPAEPYEAGSRSRCSAKAGCRRNETADRLKRKWRQLEKRIRRMEDKVTSREYEWHKRFYG